MGNELTAAAVANPSDESRSASVAVCWGSTMPLRVTPWRQGCSPVNRVAWVGWVLDVDA